MKKGKNGQQIAAENVALVNAWIEDRNKHRDWDEYAFNNRINRRVDLTASILKKITYRAYSS